MERQGGPRARVLDELKLPETGRWERLDSDGRVMRILLTVDHARGQLLVRETGP